MGTAKWVTVSGFCETSGAANEEQRLHRRMSFGSQLNIAIIRWTLLPLLHFHPAWKSHTSLELMQAIWWHVIVFFFFFTTFLSDWLGPVMTLDELTTSLEAWSVWSVFVWFGMYPVKLQTLRNIFPELGHLSEILKWLPLHGLEATQKQSLPLPVRGVLRQQRHMDSSGWRDARI